MQPSHRSVAFTVEIGDAHARSLVIDALAGPGAPLGILRCDELAAAVAVVVDESVTPAALVRDLIEIELAAACGTADGPPLGRADAARIAAAGLGEPELDERRIIEYHLERLRPC